MQATRAAHAAPTAATYSNKAPDNHVAISPSLVPLSTQTPSPLPAHHVPAAVERQLMAKPTAAAPGPGSGGKSKAKGSLEAPEDRVQGKSRVTTWGGGMTNSQDLLMDQREQAEVIKTVCL